MPYKNEEDHRANSVSYRLKHLEEEHRRNRIYQQTHKVALAARRKIYFQNHPEIRHEQHVRRQRKVKQAIIDAYGGKCQCCGETAYEFMTIDHINGDGAKHRLKKRGGISMYIEIIKAGCPKDLYRLLCMNCNFALGAYGYCPHSSIALPHGGMAAPEVALIPTTTTTTAATTVVEGVRAD